MDTRETIPIPSMKTHNRVAHAPMIWAAAARPSRTPRARSYWAVRRPLKNAIGPKIKPNTKTPAMESRSAHNAFLRNAAMTSAPAVAKGAAAAIGAAGGFTGAAKGSENSPQYRHFTAESGPHDFLLVLSAFEVRSMILTKWADARTSSS